MFRRRRQGEEPEENLELTDEQPEAAESAEAEEAAPAAEGKGPWDSEESYPELERIDFGGLQVPIGPGLEVQVNLEATEHDAEGNPVGGRMVAVTIVTGDSGLQVQAFAAPKRSGIWAEVRQETAAEIQEAGGQTQDGAGPFGDELHAMVPVQIPEEVMDQVPDEIREQGFAWQPVRFIGVDGPRWFLRGVVSGAAIEDEEQWQVLEDVFRNIVVVRGDQPMAPRELLELTLPAEAQEALAQQADEGDDGFDPFERGPEITEVR
ncbi:DUF3710 domain-containing protein [Actinomadura scrupuli]|uniref:DUF3710 domain-containing protein n=1 Tax=Actinomadura scrupuli TaxID=559629 RepID=UPI003D96AF0A